MGLPIPGRWTEILNTDAEIYGGSNIGNFGSVIAQDWGHHGQAACAWISLPPLAAVILRYDGWQD